jgi:Ca-activated chloride channel family protein
VPGASVTLAGGGLTRTTVTDAAGRYEFADVPAGTYTVTIHLAGFTPTTHAVNVSDERRRDVATEMKVSAIADRITVSASAPAPPPLAQRHMATGVVGGMVGGIVDSLLPEEQYAEVGEHAFVETGKEKVTTFAIDVDRASYANVRRFLTANQMPPASAVRIEEMLNYFTWSYPQPSGAHPFSITTEVASCPWAPDHRLVRIGIQGRNLEQWRMAPNNLVFLIDVSGSMQPPERLPLLKSAFRLLTEQLRAEDRVAIVVYAGAAGLVLPSTSGADKSTILGALDKLNAGGSTAGAQGIELAYNVAKQSFIAGGNNRVILATDGDFNVGVSSNQELEKIIEEKRSGGIYLTTIGVGTTNFHDARLEMLADKGNGNYAYLDNLQEAKKVFQQELTGTLVTIAKDVKVQLEFNPAVVQSYRQIGYENRALANKDFDDDAKDAGELGAGHSVTALYEIVPKGRGEIARIKLRYKQPSGTTSELLTAAINDTGRSIHEASADLQFAAAIAEFGMLLRNSPHKGTATYADALAMARMARGVDLDGTREEMVRMLETSRAISGEAPVASGGQ